jgi:predicted transcriptional regulator of viral defense system
MNYINFQRQFKDYLLINLADIRGIYPDFDNRRLHEWQKKGYIKKIINNFYIFIDKEFNEVDINFIANKLYEPSYLSMEYALSYYSLIPETVFWRTCVTSRKTKKISAFIGNFSYQKIKSNLFFGYRLVKINKAAWKIAEPEKALLDFLYLRKDIKVADDFYELRINGEIYKKIINQKKLNNYLKAFNSKKLFQKIIILNNILK